MIKRIIISVLFVLLFVSISNAEVIYLKNGNIIKGKIISRDANSVTVQQGKFYNKYYSSQVDRIEDTKNIAKIDLQNIDFSKLKDISPKKIGLIVSLIKANGTQKILESNIAAAIDKAPLDKRDEFKYLLDINGLVTKLIPIYDSYLTESEIEELITFYNSPVGIKVLEISPKITQKIIETMIQYFKDKLSN